MSKSLKQLQKSLEEAKLQVEYLKREFPPNEKLVNEYDGIVDIEMGLDWTMRQAEFFATHYTDVGANDSAFLLLRCEDADFDCDLIS